MLEILVESLKESLKTHLNKSDRRGELARALHTMRELKLLRGLREQFDKAKFKLPPVHVAAQREGTADDVQCEGEGGELQPEGDAGDVRPETCEGHADYDSADKVSLASSSSISSVSDVHDMSPISTSDSESEDDDSDD